MSLLLAAGLALTEQALAGTSVEVLLLGASAHTPAVVVEEERLDVFGLSQAEHHRGQQIGLGYRGLLVELGRTMYNDDARWILSAGVTHARSRYRFEGFTFSPSSVDTHLTAGILPWFATRSVPDVDAYGVFLAGLNGSILSARPLAAPTVAFAPRFSMGFGLGTRKLPTRLRAELRADIVPHFFPGRGRAELPNSAITWSWWPGSAAMSVLVGGGFGGRERAYAPSDPEPAAAP